MTTRPRSPRKAKAKITGKLATPPPLPPIGPEVTHPHHRKLKLAAARRYARIEEMISLLWTSGQITRGIAKEFGVDERTAASDYAEVWARFAAADEVDRPRRRTLMRATIAEFYRDCRKGDMTRTIKEETRTDADGKTVTTRTITEVFRPDRPTARGAYNDLMQLDGLKEAGGPIVVTGAGGTPLVPTTITHKVDVESMTTAERNLRVAELIRKAKDGVQADVDQAAAVAAAEARAAEELANPTPADPSEPNPDDPAPMPQPGEPLIEWTGEESGDDA